MPVRAIREFLRLETLGGLLLMVAAIAAIVCSNTGTSEWYRNFLMTPVSVSFGEGFSLAKPLLLWVNDGLMAIFFLMVGLEIKLEFFQGKLTNPSQWFLPMAAAAGGMFMPAIVFININIGNLEALHGWAIPTATDIAFSLGLLALFGKRVPVALKVFLMTFAILDDLAAIVVIALFYTADLSYLSMIFGIIFTAILVLLNLMRVSRISVYMVVGAALWFCVLKSGVHATLAGVIVAFLMPFSVPDPEHPGQKVALTQQTIHHVHPWVAFFIVPLFAFLNSGVSFAGITWESFFSPVTLGITLGLFLGKPIGIFFCALVVIGLGFAHMPSGVKYKQLLAVSVLGGIGFTMSLFIATLAYETKSPEMVTDARLGIMMGSLLCIIVGMGLLHLTLPKTKAITH